MNNDDQIRAKVLGARIKEIREALRLYQKDFAEKIGITNAQLATNETGTVNTSVETLLKIASVFNVNLNYLFLGKGEFFLKDEEPQKKDEREFIEGICTINDIMWLSKHSPFFLKTIIGFSGKFFIENKEILKISIDDYKAFKKKVRRLKSKY